MAPPFAIPQDVVNFIDGAFVQSNMRVAARMSNLPTIHETFLDFCFIEAISEYAAPHRLPSDYVVDMDVHFLGQGRHWESWEIADVGLIVTYRRAGTLVRTKVALLQSKRLYPREAEFVEDEGLSKYAGFGQLRGPVVLPAQEERQFRFDSTCRYRALQVGDEQWRAIAAYEDHYQIPVHYLLYHPKAVPSEQTLPVIASRRKLISRPEVGCRIVRASEMRAVTATAAWSRNYAPSYGDLRSTAKPTTRGLQSEGAPGWRLEDFVSRRLLDCQDGYIASTELGEDAGLSRVFSQRGAPISAAIRIDVNAPEEIVLDEQETGRRG